MIDLRWIALVVLLLGLASGCFQQNPKIDLTPYTALGAITAEETSRLLEGKGSIVLAVDDPGNSKDPVSEAQLATFKTALKQSGNVAVETIVAVKQEPMQRMASGGAMPADQFLKMVGSHPDASGFVLFLGFPVLTPGDAAKLKSRSAKIIVASACLPGYRELLRQGIIHTALLPRAGEAPARSRPPNSARDHFDLDYVIATPASPEIAPW